MNPYKRPARIASSVLFAITCSGHSMLTGIKRAAFSVKTSKLALIPGIIIPPAKPPSFITSKVVAVPMSTTMASL